MTKQKSTKRALLMSGLALLMCVSMLVGTTFAWFTDSVTSGVNQIIAGNLDVEVYTDDGKSIEGVDTLFNDVTLWEPGVVAYENLTVVNEGNLALKYQLAVNFENATKVPGTEKTLADVLKVGFVEGGIKSATREGALDEVKTWLPLASFAQSGVLYPEGNEDGNASKTYGVVIWWEPSDKDNDYNMNNGETTVLSIDLGVNLFATQYTYEEDSFDDQYDKGTAVFTVAEANVLLAEGKSVTLANCVEPNGVVVMPANAGTLTLKDSSIASVQAADAANIVVVGNVKVDASTCADGTSAITGVELNISGNGNLTAIANGKHAYGIGGDQTTSITIENVHIVDVKGGYVQSAITTDYGKGEPEGGAAIGSGHNGAVITLDNVTIDNAEGGSKAAGIGGRYWTGVTINITDSTIQNVVGGNCSAGIGGSRVSSGATTAESVTINIVNSIVKAVGGDYGAGIGSGYSTYLVAESEGRPTYTINIDEASVINATGGVAAAGIGTGHNVVGLAGEIKSQNVTAVAGQATCPAPGYDCCYNRERSIAQNIGFGSLADEIFKAPITSTITYLGKPVEIPVPSTVVSTAEELKAALKAGGNVVLGADIAIDNGIALADGTILNLNGHTLTDSSTGGRTFGIQNGVTATVNGDGEIAKDTTVASTYAMPFYVSGSSTAIINGGTYNMGATTEMDFNILIQKTSKMVINGGIFTNTANVSLFAVIWSSSLEINGGYFESIGAEAPDLLDVEYHASRISTITISGGTFVNYNPAEDNEGDRVVIADGYKVISETQSNGDVWYTVVAE